MGEEIEELEMLKKMLKMFNLIVGEEVAVCREMATTTKSRRVFRDIATGS